MANPTEITLIGDDGTEITLTPPTEPSIEITGSLAGPVGATGPQGSTGPTGPTGATGATGPQGPSGATTMTVGTTTINSGTNGEVFYSNSGVLGQLTNTGSGSNVLASSPTLVTPALGTPSALVLTNATSLPISTGVSGLGTGIATALAATPTGSGSVVLATSPSLTTPTLGAATATTINGLIITSTSSSATLTVASGVTISFSHGFQIQGSNSGNLIFSGVGQTFTFPSTTDTVVTLTATQTLTNKTLTTPNLGTPSAVNLTNATSTSLPIAAINATGTASSTTYLRGDGTWSTVSGGSGITRSVNSISTGTTGAATASTDYVYICTAALTFTFPTAVSNTNQYTVKNTSASGIITMATTSSQTIDGLVATYANLQPGDSLTVISDNANWRII